MTPTIELHEIRRQFGPVALLGGVNLTVLPGQVVALYGRSGSGKTTLLNIIGGLDQPDGGSVRLLGQELASFAPGALENLRRTRLGFIFQSYGLLAHLTARDNVEFGLRLAGCPRAEWSARTTRALDAVGLSDRAHHRPGELSGGERQRVAIARAMAVQPAIILADEPTGALDHATGRQIIDLLVAFARETGASICIATHDTAIRERVDAVYRISEGQLAQAQ